MGGPDSLGLFFAGGLLLIMAPGPDFLYVMTQGVSRGRWAGVLSALGIGTGLLIHTTLAAAGLTALIMASPVAFDLAKYLGAVYLVYLGLKALRRRSLLSKPGPDSGREMKAARIWQQGALTNLLNPKALLTFMAFIPQFVSSNSSSVGQIFFLGLSIALMGVSWFSLVGYFSGVVGEWLSHSGSARLVNRLAGCILVSLGVRLALLTR